jgi:mannose-1-phosphate guanylyltransferase
MTTRSEAHSWAIILAAGEGARLAAVTAAVHGHSVPKQFAAICGDRTFIQRTLDRIGPVIPPERTVVVVAESHEAMARAQLAEFRGVEIVVQPRNRGTAAGVLLPVAHVLARDPQADVVIFPSDHFVERPQVFQASVRSAMAAAHEVPAGVVLLGAAAESAAPDLGWIVGATRRPGQHVRAVESFVEKPSQEDAFLLLQCGALWNTLIIAGRARAVWQLGMRHVPQVTLALEGYRRHIGSGDAAAVLRAVYARLPTADISRDVLQAASGLGLIAMVDAGWSDCGTPERLERALGKGAVAVEVPGRALAASRLPINQASAGLKAARVA